MRLYVISLLRSADRRRAMTSAFAERNLEFEWVDGRDWRDLTEEQLAQVDREARTRQGRRPLRLGAAGCWLSHRDAMLRLAKSGDRMAAVFEDDVRLFADVGRALGEIESTAQKFDLVFLHRNKPEKRFVPVKRLADGRALGIVRFKDWGTQAYVITREAAERFLREHQRMVHAIDHELHTYWESGMLTYTLNPPVVAHAHEDAGSVLQEAPVLERRRTPSSVARRLRSLAREEWARRDSFRKRIRAGE